MGSRVEPSIPVGVEEHQHIGVTRMANTKQDRAKVAGGQDHEVRYEAEKEGVSKQAVKDAVKEVGNSRSKVEVKLEEGDL
jgi:hypothetical protein